MGAVEATACYRELGADLRRMRESAGMTGTDLAERTARDRTRLSRIESGTMRVGEAEIVQYAVTCGLRSSQAMAMAARRELAERSAAGYWMSDKPDDSLRSLMFHESTATAVTYYDPVVVNGLLQTADYARSIISRETWRDAADVEEFVQIRLSRQHVLYRPNPAAFTFFAPEEVLRRQIGDGLIMHEQLLQMVLVSALPQVCVRVVPSIGEDLAAFGNAFQVLTFEKHRPLVYLDIHTTGLFLEDKIKVGAYRQLVPAIADAALDERESREFLAELASEYDRGSAPDAGTDNLEEEQL